MTTAQLGNSGIVIGATDANGCRWRWSGGGSDPWSPSPAPRDVVGDNPTDQGSWDATEFYGPRSFSLEGWVTAPTHGALHQAKTRLFAACGLRPFALRVVEPSYDRFAIVRRGGEPSWSEINPDTPPTARFSVPLWAGDPRIYSTELETATTRFPSSLGGLTLPLTIPFSIAATTVAGTLSLTNEGSFTAMPTFRIDGPVVRPSILNDDTGQAMNLDLTILDGEWVTINTDTGQVLGNGQEGAPRRAQWWGDWFGIRPGPNNLRAVADSSDANALLTATWRSAWI